jgi:hypothetical protein
MGYFPNATLALSNPEKIHGAIKAATMASKRANLRRMRPRPSSGRNNASKLTRLAALTHEEKKTTTLAEKGLLVWIHREAECIKRKMRLIENALRPMYRPEKASKKYPSKKEANAPHMGRRWIPA